ncbi:MAG: hypothetical protein HWN81_15085 [Candidatus Lokiarchaeota archaeon]|nr:hypothetical protein [Candidatus Lokiarchaeota archaeon]
MNVKKKILSGITLMGSEEDRRQHDYINYYYEQKEKFIKRFLNKEESISKEQISQPSNRSKLLPI